MNKHAKSMIILSILGILILSVLAECRKTQAEEVYEMVMEIIISGYPDRDMQMVEDAVNKITVPEIGVRVRFLPVSITDMETKLGQLVSGGEQIDLAQTGLLTTPADLVANDLLLDMTDYIEGSEILSSLAGGLIEACRVHGAVYAYPANLYPARGYDFYYDAEFAEENHIQMPERIRGKSDWEDIFRQVKVSGKEIYPVSFGDGVNQELSWGAVFENFGDDSYCSYGVVMDMENGTKVENWYATDEYLEQCRLHRKWLEEGYALPDSLNYGYTVGDSFLLGKVFGVASPYGTGINQGGYSVSSGKRVEVIPVSDPVITRSSVINSSWGIPVSCRNPEKVIRFLELLYTDSEIANLLNNGIEGVHYTVEDGKNIIFYPDGISAGNVGYKAFIDCYGDIAKTYHMSPLTEEFVESVPDFGIEKAKVSRFLGYSFDTSKVSADIVAVHRVISRYGPALSCGEVDPDVVVPRFLKELEEAGIQNIIDENQRQLDIWLAETDF